MYVRINLNFVNVNVCRLVANIESLYNFTHNRAKSYTHESEANCKKLLFFKRTSGVF